MALKLIVMNDLHHQGANPRGRTDDYPAAIELKIREVFKIAEAENARAILIAGDLFNSPGVSIPTFLRLYRLLKESPCEILTIHGSPDHDGLAASIDRTWYQVLADAGAIQDVEQQPYDLDGHLVITGKGANPDTDHGMDDYLAHQPRGPVHIQLAHGMLLERAPGADCPFRYTLLEAVAAHPDAPDVLVCGHYHPGWGIKRIDRTLFVNPGALARTSAALVDMERAVQVAVLEVDGIDVDARLVPLQSARPGHEVLSRKHIENEAAKAEIKSKFMADLGAGDELKQIEIDSTLEILATREGFPAGVLAETRRQIGLARESLGVSA